MTANFQDGCNTLVSKCTACGSTPANNSPTAISNSIQSIYTNRYNAGTSSGYTSGYNAGTQSGYTSGTAYGYNQGTKAGYNTGTAAASFSPGMYSIELSTEKNITSNANNAVLIKSSISCTNGIILAAVLTGANAMMNMQNYFPLALWYSNDTNHTSDIYVPFMTILYNKNSNSSSNYTEVFDHSSAGNIKFLLYNKNLYVKFYSSQGRTLIVRTWLRYIPF